MDSQNFFESLKTTENGRKYLKLVYNNQVGDVRYEKGYERHHIHPRALGGTDEKSNIVKLSVFDHILAHVYLAKAFPCYDTVAATCIMCGKRMKQLSEVQKITLTEIAEQANLRELRRKYRRPKTEAENLHFVEQSKKTRLEKYGSLMKQALMPEVIQERLRRTAARYEGDSAGQMHTPESKLSRKIQMVSKYGGCTKHMQNPEIVEKARQTRLKHAKQNREIMQTDQFMEWFRSHTEYRNAFQSVSKFLKERNQTREEYLTSN